VRINGLEYHVEVEGHGPPLLLLHGFTGSARTWDLVRATLNTVARTVALDLVGHGRSAAPAEVARYTMQAASADLAAALDSLGIQQAAVLGYSMGGRLALDFALRCPERVQALVLESASPGIADPTERARRAASDEELAARIEREGVEAFVAGWEQQPLLALGAHVPDRVRQAQRAERLSHTALGLANSLRGMGAGRQLSRWACLPRLATPVWLVVGERDARYVDIARRTAERLPRAEVVQVPGAGHTVHLDQPDAVCALVKDRVVRN
jgi:2-succinyl-6-hydroxy-2,4-cyclohexadiene-1-carboxylate synthase